MNKLTKLILAGLFVITSMVPAIARDDSVRTNLILLQNPSVFFKTSESFDANKDSYTAKDITIDGKPVNIKLVTKKHGKRFLPSEVTLKGGYRFAGLAPELNSGSISVEINGSSIQFPIHSTTEKDKELPDLLSYKGSDYKITISYEVEKREELLHNTSLWRLEKNKLIPSAIFVAVTKIEKVGNTKSNSNGNANQNAKPKNDNTPPKKAKAPFDVNEKVAFYLQIPQSGNMTAIKDNGEAFAIKGHPVRFHINELSHHNADKDIEITGLPSCVKFAGLAKNPPFTIELQANGAKGDLMLDQVNLGGKKSLRTNIIVDGETYVVELSLENKPFKFKQTGLIQIHTQTGNAYILKVTNIIEPVVVPAPAPQPAPKAAAKNSEESIRAAMRRSL